jgi:hypothetical protein
MMINRHVVRNPEQQTIGESASPKIGEKSSPGKCGAAGRPAHCDLLEAGFGTARIAEGIAEEESRPSLFTKPSPMAEEVWQGTKCTIRSQRLVTIMKLCEGMDEFRKKFSRFSIDRRGWNLLLRIGGFPDDPRSGLVHFLCRLSGPVILEQVIRECLTDRGLRVGAERHFAD